MNAVIMTKEKADQARKMLKSGISRRIVAKEFGISMTHVRRIQRNQTWRLKPGEKVDQ